MNSIIFSLIRDGEIAAQFAIRPALSEGPKKIPVLDLSETTSLPSCDSLRTHKL